MINQNKMTAVEWFFNEIKHILPNDFLVKYEQAKEMNQQQIVEAFFQGVDRESDCHGARYLDEKDAEKYYNTTFKSE